MGKDGKEEKAWNKGKIPMMFVHPQSAGHGLNLQHGGSTMVIFDLIYSLRYYLQLIGRIDRQGQTKPVVIYILIAKNTRDEDAYGALVNKEDGQALFFAILKKLIIKYRKNKAKQLEDDEL
jgi:SNF2 family DNA or RNA helicase